MSIRPKFSLQRLKRLIRGIFTAADSLKRLKILVIVGILRVGSITAVAVYREHGASSR